MSLEKVENCNKCSLCQNQRPLLDKEDRCDVMWVGLSAKRVDDLNNSIPLSNDTNSGKIIELIETAIVRLSLNNNKLKSSKVKIFVPLVAALVLIPLAFGIFSKIKNTNSNYDNNVSVLSENSKIKEIYNYEETVDNSVESTNKDFTDTNVQVQGVQEADIIKTDGDYIYYLEEI